jgi:hypothetical protein
MDYTMKEVANKLNVTYMAIYKQRYLLIEKGLAYKTDEGNFFINNNGYNYLIEKRKNRLELLGKAVESPKENKTENKSEEIFKIELEYKNKEIEILKNTIEQQKQQIEILNKQNDSLIYNQRLFLGTHEDNTNNKKRHWWNR